MGLGVWSELIYFLILFIMFAIIFLFNTITVLHKVYLVFHFLMMLWPISQFAVLTTDNPMLQLFYLKASFVGLSLLGSGWLIFAIFLTGQSYLLTRIRLFWLGLPSLFAAAGVVCNPWDWFVLPVDGDFKEREYGPLFWFTLITLSLYIVFSIYHLYSSYRTAKTSRHRLQIVLATIGILILSTFALADLVVNVVFAEQTTMVIGLTSWGILLSGLYFLIAIQVFKVFHVIRLDQKDVLDSMSTGIIVLDEHGIVLDVNSAVRPLFSLRPGDFLDISRLLAPLHIEGDVRVFLKAYEQRKPEGAQIEISLGSDSHMSIYTAPIFDSGMALIGRIITFQDVSELRRLVDESYRQNEVLQERNRALMLMQDELYKANQLLEQMAVTDSLTGCYNRRYLMQQMEHEVMKNMRYQIPFSIFLFDIDLFKNVNDRFGHIIGDEVLSSTAAVVKRMLRRTDVLARYGGEEFSVYLPHTNEEQALLLAQRVKEAVEFNIIQPGPGNHPIGVTISLGVLSVDKGGRMSVENPKGYLRELFSEADAALYEAKHGGRNRIVSIYRKA
ncbi:histidine kinase N-terminal 7TM domain-containing diguanylate cyclase [Paenibacillus roseus]|uniref:histidine kinase N-terminal 7TM domain-containing diguanylate cyclase n=1 Tax=Paenibacillus roseus TaxID=2798579 RepID=UPI002FCE3A54